MLPVPEQIADVSPSTMPAPITNVSDCANGRCAITRERTIERKATVQRAAPAAERKPVRRLLGRLRRR
jgi:hypothetical protein